VVLLTLVLFVSALFVKAVTHELFLEAGVFLVSVQLIKMAHKNTTAAARTEERLLQIQTVLRTIEERMNTPQD